MHARVISLIAVGIVLASLGGWHFSEHLLLPLLVFAVGLVGVPHGALDHVTGRETLAGRFPDTWPAIFITAYVTTGVLMASCWFVSPLLAILVFFGCSAWHFGSEDLDTDPFDQPGSASPNTFQPLTTLAIGSLAMTVPAVCQPDRLAELLTRLAPESLHNSGLIAADLCRDSAFLLLPIAIYYIGRSAFSSTTTFLLSLSLLGMFAVADPLLSFLVYFCGWHSVRGLARLKQQTKTSWLELVRQLAPLTLAALAIGFAGWSLLIMNQQPSDAMLRTLFIGLSAIAVPHLILHSVKGMGDSLQPSMALGGGRPR